MLARGWQKPVSGKRLSTLLFDKQGTDHFVSYLFRPYSPYNTACCNMLPAGPYNIVSILCLSLSLFMSRSLSLALSVCLFLCVCMCLYARARVCGPYGILAMLYQLDCAVE